MTEVELARVEAARQRAERIRAGMVVIAGWRDEVIAAYRERDWEVLGHRSWQEYLDEEFGEVRVKLSRDDRAEIVAGMTEANMSTRAIAAAVGVDQKTIVNDQRKRSGEENSSPGAEPVRVEPRAKKVIGIDGKSYTKPSAPVVPERPALHDDGPGPETQLDAMDRLLVGETDDVIDRIVEAGRKAQVSDLSRWLHVLATELTGRAVEVRTGGTPGRQGGIEHRVLDELHRLVHLRGGERGVEAADLLVELRDRLGSDWTPSPLYPDTHYDPDAARRSERGPLRGVIRSGVEACLGGRLPSTRSKVSTDAADHWITNTALDAYALAADQFLFEQRAKAAKEAREAAEDEQHDAELPAVVPAQGTRRLVQQLTEAAKTLVSRDSYGFVRRVRKADRDAVDGETNALRSAVEAAATWTDEVTEYLGELDR